MISLALIVLCLFPRVKSDFINPSYQVFLQKNNGLKVLGVGQCYGNIIQSHLILTAASCLLNANETSKSKAFVKPEELTVSFKREDLKEIIYFVKGLHVHPQFNTSSLDHDIAVLSLRKQLPLTERKDIEWVLLGDYDSVSTKSGLEDKDESNVWKDVDLGVHPGSGVIHNSNLIGIVSFAPLSDDIHESDLYNGFRNKFTPISPYLNWIYDILQNAEITDMQNNDYSVSLPYHQQKNAEMVNKYVETEAGYLTNSAVKFDVNGIASCIFTLPLIVKHGLTFYLLS